ncbi:hypothetical protein [Actinopolymorpha alba]|uniref:hypothetical protein n=1 Tax=Actinopolymorpha alba TaxID=533267 RepID=UPI000369F308|nr:hypothetical protein [Actinopolymorpha alba]
MINISSRVLNVVAAGHAVPYIASKIQFAIEGKLGIHGGPRVTPADYARFGNTDAVAAAQWGNVAVGVLFLLITLVPLTPLAARLNRWIIAVPLIAIGCFLLSFGLGGVIRAATTELGGGIFGGYLLLWSVAVGLLAAAQLSAGRARQHPRG